MRANNITINTSVNKVFVTDPYGKTITYQPVEWEVDQDGYGHEVVGLLVDNQTWISYTTTHLDVVGDQF